MAFKQDDLDKLDAAILSGVKSVTFADGRRTEFHTLVEMRGLTIIINADRAVLADEVRGWVADGMSQAAVQGAAGGAQIGKADASRAAGRSLGRRWRR